MMAVDEALGQVFKTRFTLKHQKKRQKGWSVEQSMPARSGLILHYTFSLSDDEKSLLHFKLRALDLLEVFLRRESTNPLFLVRKEVLNASVYVMFLFIHVCERFAEIRLIAGECN